MAKWYKKIMKRVIVFGVFDGFHPGHESFLRQAAKNGSVAVVVACDFAVKKIKGRAPRESQSVRLRRLRRVPYIRSVVLGDTKQGSYAVVKKHKPDIICLGYDQKYLGEDLKKKMRRGIIPEVKMVRLKSYYPHKYHSSKLNDL